MKNKVTLALLLTLLASNGSADTIRDAHVGCITRESVDEFVDAAVSNDARQMQALMATQCISIQGLQFSVVDRGWGVSQIRVYNGTQSYLLWTVSEAIR